MNKHTLERKAVKIIMKEDMGAEEKDLLTAEIAIMKLVNHPNIIRMEAVYESKKVRRPSRTNPALRHISDLSNPAKAWSWYLCRYPPRNQQGHVGAVYCVVGGARSGTDLPILFLIPSFDGSLHRCSCIDCHPPSPFCAPSRKGCSVDCQTTQASNK